MIEELNRVVLTEDLPEGHLRAGDLGVVVLVHGEHVGYTVEFVTLDGETVAGDSRLRWDTLVQVVPGPNRLELTNLNAVRKK